MKRFPSRLMGFRPALQQISETANWWVSPTPSASFLTHYSAHRRAYQHALRGTGREWGALWEWESKIGVRNAAERIGVMTPQILQGPCPIAEIDFDPLPSAFVLKPDLGAGRAGVMVLTKGPDGYRDILRGGRLMAEDEIRCEIEQLDSKGSISGSRMLAEEALLRSDLEISYDWKLYCFQGEVCLIWQISRLPEGKQSKYYDGDWRDLGDAKWFRPATAALPPPALPEVLIDVGKRLSLEVPVPFVRIDLYERGGDVFLGELTPMPGSAQRFKRPIDIALGEAWERASGRLMAQTANR